MQTENESQEQVQSRKQTEIDSLKRISFVKTIIILILFIGGGIIAYNYYSPKFSFNPDNLALKKPMWSPEPTESALTNLGAYRSNTIYATLAWYNKSKSHGVVHDTTSMKEYITFFKSFCEKHDPASGYEWKVGYYPMVCKELYGGDMRPRLSVYMIPTMVSKKDPNVILDYMDPQYASYYPSKTVAPEQYIYNQGTIFP